MLDPVFPVIPTVVVRGSHRRCSIKKQTFFPTKVSFSNKFIISHNVCSLFTSIPLKETIVVAENLIFDRYLDLLNSRTRFLFDSNYYDQIDGVVMGFPLGPFLAKLLWVSMKRERSVSVLWCIIILSICWWYYFFV